MIRRGFSSIFSRVTDKMFLAVGPWLRERLARTPLIWGDPSRLTVGRNVLLVDAIINLRSGRIDIGDDVFFGHGVMLLTGKHSMERKGVDRQRLVSSEGRDIVIGEGAWIASGAIIIGPCTIGPHCVIGAGAVVTGQVAEGTFLTGNDQRRVRQIDFIE